MSSPIWPNKRPKACYPIWKDDPAMQAWSLLMDKYYPDGDKDDNGAIFGYAAAETLVQVLNQCGNDLSRENIMRQAASLKGYRRAQSGSRLATSSKARLSTKPVVEAVDRVGAWGPRLVPLRS